jgi:hypothetical protein
MLPPKVPHGKNQPDGLMQMVEKTLMKRSQLLRKTKKRKKTQVQSFQRVFSSSNLV